MKKLLSLTAVALISATALCGCNGSDGAAMQNLADNNVRQPSYSQDAESHENEIEIKFNGNSLGEFLGEIRGRSDIAGVRRHFRPTPNGTYTLEYAHARRNGDTDILDYTLTLNADNTFDFTAVNDLGTFNSSGHWYERRHNIMLFYDDVRSNDTKHMSGTAFADMLPHGKIMLRDKHYTIVLAKQDEGNAPDTDNNNGENTENGNNGNNSNNGDVNYDDMIDLLNR